MHSHGAPGFDSAASLSAEPMKEWDRRNLTLGVEEEFHLIDLRSRRLTPRASELLEALQHCSGTFAAELQQTVIETNSEVTSSLSALRQNLVALRAELVNAARPLGVGIASAGTMPLSVPLTITETPRFRRMLADYQLLVREQLICGMQVHVGIPDRDIAARLMSRVEPWSPVLLALSASSPYSHDGHDTGYASSRNLIWTRWPTSGRAGQFESAAEYEALVRSLVASGTISDPGMIYFDVRPSAHVPTLELRVCDACQSVDTVVLIAGLFRAVVARELALLDEPNRPEISPNLYRAAMWRAARSGLEGELVDLRGPRSVPAGVLVRAMVQELRPELEAAGDWDNVLTLSEAALSHGSGAARQREALRRYGRITDVVDLIVAETTGEASMLLEEPPPMRIIAGYRPPGFDDAVLPDGRVRASHAEVLSALGALSVEELNQRREQLEAAKRKAGVVFRTRGEDQPSAFAVDFVPRVLSGEEWSRLQGGTAQRARALDAFLRDVYGEAAIVQDGILPRSLVARCPGRLQAATVWPADVRRAHVSGFDVVRDAEGRWLVLEDNLRVPSGVAYAIQNRRLLREAFPRQVSLSGLHDPEEAPRLLLKLLEESAPKGAPDTPSIIVLSEGEGDSAYFEHRMLAEAMGIPLLTPKDLLVEGDSLSYVDEKERSHPVDVIYLRMDDVLSQLGHDGQLLGPKLLRAVHVEKLSIVNALGNGLGDDKAIYAYVPQFIDYYLGESPLLEQVPTYVCADPEQREHVLSRLHELVLKPVDGYGGFGVTVGPYADENELAEIRGLIIQQPARWIAQETVKLSTHPTYDREKLRPRHVDLRVFVYYGREPVVVPAALTRVAPENSLIVNSSRGGGAKDTWLTR
jgi:glutamate---cysteine ligase / carboxylate-amine ligase